ncbi:MAG: ATP phosphoribosyltransferase [Pseudomonadota bacterium]
MSGPLIIAVPSKGRLQENADAFFLRAGLKMLRERGARDYRGRIDGIDQAEVLFLSASEIAGELARGAVHLGVTGEDLIRETIPDADLAIEPVTPLGFGYARVVVAVPQVWIDVETMADLDDVAQSFRARRGRRLRVATKYVTLTRSFFARHAVADYRIVESLGATEGAPASGAADLIVDITTTGATLAANALKVLRDGVILESEANLFCALRANWSTDARSALATILDRVAAEERARTTREVKAAVSGDVLQIASEAEALFGCAAPYSARETALLRLHCPEERLYALVDWLKTKGARAVSVGRLDYVFEAKNPIHERVLTRIDSIEEDTR